MRSWPPPAMRGEGGMARCRWRRVAAVPGTRPATVYRYFPAKTDLSPHWWRLFPRGARRTGTWAKRRPAAWRWRGHHHVRRARLASRRLPSR